MQLLNEFSESELLLTNINLIPGLSKKQWFKNRGARIVQPFKDDQGRTIIHEIYNYTMKNGDREIETYSRKLQFFNEDGTVIMFGDKDGINTTPDITPDHIADINKGCRNWRMDYLERAAKNLAALAATLPSPYKEHYIDVSNSIEDLLEHYSEQIFKYRNRNFLTTDLETAIVSEVDPAVITLLGKWVKVPQTDPEFPYGLTTRQSIMYQLNGIMT